MVCSPIGTCIHLHEKLISFWLLLWMILFVPGFHGSRTIPRCVGWSSFLILVRFRFRFRSARFLDGD
ncbi:unnamed protein product [Nezara viridula]|uniref:Uncharacterized protein n=1 Tax=Nezara viridula TaxID=85310 RepID=A0A9P0HLN1_NEZVI|nr:unnamed protein product [Nezara viridula]